MSAHQTIELWRMILLKKLINLQPFDLQSLQAMQRNPI